MDETPKDPNSLPEGKIAPAAADDATVEEFPSDLDPFNAGLDPSESTRSAPAESPQQTISQPAAAETLVEQPRAPAPSQAPKADTLEFGSTLTPDRTVSEARVEAAATPAPVAPTPNREAPEERGAEKQPEPEECPSFFARAKVVTWELAKIIIIVLLLRAYGVQASTVDGNSMEPTLHGKEGIDQDYLLVERFTATMANLPGAVHAITPDAITPEFSRGDIVVLASPENASNELVKRIVAVEGDYVFWLGQTLYINGVPEAKLTYIPKAVGKDHAVSEIPTLDADSDGMVYNVEQDAIDRADDLKIEDDALKAKMKKLGMSSNFIKRLHRDLNPVKFARVGIRVPKDCVMVVGDNRSPSGSNDSRAWLDIEAPNSPDKKRLWATRQLIHGRVVARMKLPWNYDETHPLRPK